MSEPASSAAVALVGGDLNAVARVEAACRAAGRELRRARTVADALEDPPPGLVVVDLDEGGPALVAALVEARRSGRLTSPVIAFYSHVDAAAGDAAEGAGIRAVPRGRFWRELAELVQRF